MNDEEKRPRFGWVRHADDTEEQLVFHPDPADPGAFQALHAGTEAPLIVRPYDRLIVDFLAADQSISFNTNFVVVDLDDYLEMTFTCMVCGAERSDADTSVVHRPIQGYEDEFPGMHVNVCHCNDRPECVKAANDAGPWPLAFSDDATFKVIPTLEAGRDADWLD